MSRIDADTLYGTLSLLILRTLAQRSFHGLEIQRRIHALAEKALHIEEGALYPALHRLERDGLLEAEWGISTKGRRAKFYRLTATGRRRLTRETEGWLNHVRAVMRVLEMDRAASALTPSLVTSSLRPALPPTGSPPHPDLRGSKP
jgi:transcriptional regulator